jgi:hypothetical protein
VRNLSTVDLASHEIPKSERKNSRNIEGQLSWAQLGFRVPGVKRQSCMSMQLPKSRKGKCRKVGPKH